MLFNRNGIICTGFAFKLDLQGVGEFNAVVELLQLVDVDFVKFIQDALSVEVALGEVLVRTLDCREGLPLSSHTLLCLYDVLYSRHKIRLNLSFS
jgi:hypothetical protein